jgi:hypothetical protein
MVGVCNWFNISSKYEILWYGCRNLVFVYHPLRYICQTIYELKACGECSYHSPVILRNLLLCSTREVLAGADSVSRPMKYSGTGVSKHGALLAESHLFKNFCVSGTGGAWKWFMAKSIEAPCISLLCYHSDRNIRVLWVWEWGGTGSVSGPWGSQNWAVLEFACSATAVLVP